jgi:amino acid adenylation domain-containing protein
MSMIDNLAGLSLEEKRDLARKLLRDRNHLGATVFPLSEGQRALWFVYQLAPDSPAYNFVYAARIEAAIDELALEEAVSALFERHPLLRCTFSMPQRKPLFRVHDPVHAVVEFVGADGWSKERIVEHVRSAALVPFDLEKGPCVRIALYRTGPNESVLSLAVHHILADLWSMNLLVEELHGLYEAVIDGRAHALPSPTARYVDYIRWQRDWLISRHGARAWEFWKTALADAPPCLELPADRPRPKVQTYRGDAVSCSIEPVQLARLRDLAARENATLFTVFFSAALVLLRRYTGQDDLVIGTATAGRNRPEWERVVGYFLNQVPLRVRVDVHSDFVELVRRAQRAVLQALEHEDFPFNLIVDRLRPARDPSRSPIFQVMFIWDKSVEFSAHEPANGYPFGASQPAEPLVMEQCGAPFDLTLIVFEREDDLTFSIRYNVDLFDRATIERMAGHFQTLLGGVVDNPRRRLAELPILSDQEAKQILRFSQGPARSEARQLPPFSVLFEKQVERSPAATAVVCDGRATTYRELNSRANRLAHHLRKLGIRAGDLVGICLPRSSDMIATILAIWKAGAAYLPLDPTYPRLRLSGMIEDASPASIVTSGDLAPRLADFAGPLVVLDQAEAIEDEPDSNPVPSAAPDDLAYAIFTSGSTGKPKAALLRHRGLSNLSEAQLEVFGLGPSDRALQFASLSFDASVFEIVMPLRVGATLVVAGQSAIVPGPKLIALIRDERLTTVLLPPSVLALLPCVDLPELRTLIVAGEACPASLVSHWAPGRRFFNAYGPTETTVWASTAICSADGKPPSIGRPIANTRLFVLDDQKQLVPFGVPGELHIAGPGVGLGYLNRPELTLDHFVPNQYGDDDDGVLYKTGDIVRLRPDGELEFLGRRDHQIKIRGYRIDLGEIQEVLRQHPAVQDALVISQTLEGCDAPSLVGYLACADPGQCPIAQIRSLLRDRLPYYMVPAALVPMATLPIAFSGKVDRSALPPVNGAACRHDRATAHEPAGGDAPDGPVEAKLAQIWTAVLKNGPVGIHDNFFDLGGASLQTLEVVALAESAGISVTPELILQHQSIAELAPRCKLLNGWVEPPAFAAEPVVQPDHDSRGTSNSTKSSTRRTVIEGLGTYLPDQKLSTHDVISGCRVRLDLPIERMTGIKNRRIAGAGEYSIDLAAKAVADCLSRSACQPDEIDLLICCNISRCDGPDFQFSYEPSTAARLQERFGLVHALAFDLSNACAGTFTAIALADCFFQTGIFRNALVVSGEYITHLQRTAQLEIESFVDPRLACLTLGDSGVAILLGSSDSDGIGFQDLDLMTLGAHSDLCVARATERSHGGAIMLTDAVRASAITIREAVRHSLETLKRHGWVPESIDQLIMHQTSETTLDGAIREINRLSGREACHRDNTMYNLAELGNTATNTHMLALAEAIRTGRVRPGSKVVFAISGSGQTVGTALYAFGEARELLAPDPERDARSGRARVGQAFQPDVRLESLTYANHSSAAATGGDSNRRPSSALTTQNHLTRRVRIAAVATVPDPESSGVHHDALSMAVGAAESCIQNASIDRATVGLVLHAGVYRDDFQSEPALAAMAAGRLGINHLGPSLNGEKTLAFDLTNGAVGALNACFAATHWILVGRAARALVLASEVENNARFGPDALLGVQATGSALLLEESSTGEGFGRFCFRNFGEYVDDIRAFTATRAGAAMLNRECDPEWEQHFALCLRIAVAELLETEALSRDQIAFVLPPQGSSRFIAHLAEFLELPRGRFVELPGDQGDSFTSSLAYGFLEARRSGRARPGDLGLILSAGSGGQVGCCLYHF